MIEFFLIDESSLYLIIFNQLSGDKNMHKIIGVMGSSNGEIPSNTLNKAFKIGKLIGQNGYALLTGGTLGIPEKAVEGCKSVGGLCIAVSPACNLEEHIKKYNQSDKSDLYIYSGMGDFGRNILNARSSDAIIFITGGMGTLSEFAASFGEGKVIGVLTNTQGITDLIDIIIHATQKQPKNKILFDPSPEKLLNKVLAEI